MKQSSTTYCVGFLRES